MRVSVLLVLLAAALPAAAGAADTRPRFVIAVLGDSYASGEASPDIHGNHSLGGDLFAAECSLGGCFTETWWSPDSWFAGRDAIFPQQDDEGWQVDARRCHRSSKAPGPQAAMLIADRFPQIRVEVLDFACGGSRLGLTCQLFRATSTGGCGAVEGGQGGMLLPWPGPEPPCCLVPDLPPQLTQLRDYAASTGRAVDAVIANIGGNDAEFANLVVECLDILPDFDDNCSDNNVVTRIRDRLTPDASSSSGPSLTVEARLSQRYLRLNNEIRSSTNNAGRPNEFYLTGLPNPTHDAPPAADPDGNPEDFCDGTQTDDDIYKNATRRESATIETVLSGLNGAMERASSRHGWIFMEGLFDEWRDHGICADGASFFRTNRDAQRIQGDEGVPLPNISSGVAHPNEAGYANRARSIADLVEEQLRLRFTSPALQLSSVERDRAFTVSWADPSPGPAELAETRWEIELASPGSVQRFFSSGAGELDGFTQFGNSFQWRVARLGEFQVRVRGCRSASATSAAPQRAYCSPFSNAVTVATGRPGTPVDFRRLALTTLDRLTTNPIRLGWTAGPNTPASVRYEVHYGRFGGGCTGTTISTCTLLSSSGVAKTTSTSLRINVPQTGEWGFRVRACSTAGCSAFSGFLIAEITGTATTVKSPVGTFVVRAPRTIRAGRQARVEVAWRTPRRWTDLDRMALRIGTSRALGERRRRPVTIRFTQDDGVLWAIRGGKRRFGRPDGRGTLRAGPVRVRLRRSSVVRFGATSPRVVLRLGLVLSRRLAGETVTLSLSARDDVGRVQGRRLAGVVRVAPPQ